MKAQKSAQDVLARIIAREQQRYEAVNKHIDVMSAEENALLEQNRIRDFLPLNAKKDRLLDKSAEIHRFICELDAIAHGVSVDLTYDCFADKDDIPPSELKKEAV